ncbi:MAG TPA: YafY family protein [Baekduia sp.]|nr:YafY family protein [Baekduia sp.]
MSRPATRLLGFLELLQGRSSVTGTEAAAVLGVDARTVRRYVEALQELGIPVAGQRGAGGGYRLLPGYRLPPLMLGDDEATAVVAGLLATRRLGLAGAEPALAKVRRVLPAALRRRAEALENVLAFGDVASTTVPPVGETLLALADAARRHRRVAATYTPASGAARTRELDPFGVVVHGGRWYVSARDARSGETRTFRADRFAGVVLGEPVPPPPDGFDAVAAVARSLARVPYAHTVEVWLDAPVAHVRERVPATIAELTPDGDGTLLRMRADSLRWVAELLAGVGAPFVVRAPAALRAEVRAVAELLMTSAR